MDSVGMLENRIQEITQLHIKYLKAQTLRENVRYIKIDGNGKEFYEICKYIEKEYGRKLAISSIEQRLKTIIENVGEISGHSKETDSKLLVYDIQQKFHNEVDLQNQNYRCHLLKIYFQNVHQEIPHLSEKMFKKLVSVFSPYLKLEIVIEQRSKGILPTKESLKQLFECILYPNFSREDCHEIIFNKVQTFDYEFVTFKLKSLDNCWGYLGDHQILDVTIKHGNVDKTYNFFMKFFPKGTGNWDKMASDAFKKEIFVYQELIPQMKKICAADLVDFSPQCYFLKENEVIVLENLTPLGYSFLDTSKFATFEWIVSVIEQLSKFHACSIILEQKLIQKDGKRLGDLYAEYLHEVIYVKNGALGLNAENFVNGYFIDESAEFWTEMSPNEFKKKLVMASERVFEDVKKSENFYNVICHGDVSSRNVLSNELQQCCIIDFQLIRYCAPAMDLLFLIYNHSSRELRNKYMDKFVVMYYNSLKDKLELCNIDINQFYSLETFYRSVNYYKSSCITLSLIYLQYDLYPRESRKEFDNSPVKIAKYYNEERSKTHKEKIRCLLKDLYDIYNRSDNKE